MPCTRYAAKRTGVSMETFFREELGDGVVDVALVNLSEAYIVWEREDGTRTCWIAKVQFNAPHPGVLHYQMVEERNGIPCFRADRCPETILDQLDEPPTRGAARWRASCRNHHERRSAKPTLADGDWVLFVEPRRLDDDGWEERLFQVFRWGRRDRGHAWQPASDPETRYRLRNFRDARWFRITGREDLKPLLAHESEAIREEAVRALGVIDFEQDGALARAS